MHYFYRLTILALLTISGCEASETPSKLNADACLAKKLGVLLVSHGSHSEQWREMLMKIEDDVRPNLLECEVIDGIRSAFMEYTEPSIATRLKEFDEEGYSDVVVVPILLTVSSHSFDDIPAIMGQKEDVKTLDALREEGIEIYKPRANVTVAPLLDFPDTLEKNVAGRIRDMSTKPDQEGVVLVAYGSEPYNDEWEQLLDQVGSTIKSEIGVQFVNHCWCGHIVRYKTEPTEKAIEEVLQNNQTAIVVPVLVAVDENFQGKIIGGAIRNINQAERVKYRHDSILPDSNINNWVINISQKLATEMAN